MCKFWRSKFSEEKTYPALCYLSSAQTFSWQPLTMASNFEYNRTDNIEWRSGRLKDIFDLGRRIITATWKVSCWAHYFQRSSSVSRLFTIIQLWLRVMIRIIIILLAVSANRLVQAIIKPKVIWYWYFSFSARVLAPTSLFEDGINLIFLVRIPSQLFAFTAFTGCE